MYIALSPAYTDFSNVSKALSVICKDYESKLTPIGPQGRSTQAVSADVDRLLSPKSQEELDSLETQISAKLQSKEPIDVEYWEQLLSSIAVYKAKAELNKVYKSIIDSRLAKLREEQTLEADIVKGKLASLLYDAGDSKGVSDDSSIHKEKNNFLHVPDVKYSRQIDPEPLLKLRPEDKGHDILDETDFINKIVGS